LGLGWRASSNHSPQAAEGDEAQSLAAIKLVCHQKPPLDQFGIHRKAAMTAKADKWGRCCVSNTKRLINCDDGSASS
jgi:hypothetical protein